MALFRTVTFFAIFGLAITLSSGTEPIPKNVNLQDMDRSVKPGDDFYRFANGAWLRAATVPTGQSSYGTSAMLIEKTGERVRNLMQEAARIKPGRDGFIRKVGDYYASFMDDNAIEARGLRPLAAAMGTISAISNRRSLSEYLGTTLNTEVDGLTSNSDHLFGVWVNQGFEDSEHYVFHLFQGGLGLPDRDDYIDPSPKLSELRAEYQAHIAAILKLAGLADSESRAAHILALEIRIAHSHAPDSAAADVFTQNNEWKRRDFDIKAPGIDWDAYFSSAGVANQPVFIVWQPSAISGTAALVGGESLDVWKDYLRFHLIEHYANALPRVVAREDSTFYGRILAGTQETPDRSKIAIAATNAALGQAVGQLYTQRYFPADAKAKAAVMVANLIAAYRARIPKLSWMSEETKKNALAKLDGLTIGVGYPDKWMDYSTLEVERDDAFGNMRRAEGFNRLNNLAKLKRPADAAEWRIDPQIVGAVIVFTPNSEFFSAGILQPPYFDSEGDAASNYGSAGAGIAHEISHSFDELGNIYDAQGRLGLWWTAEDTAKYHAATEKLATQFDRYCPFADLCVNGKQVLNENIADLAGLLVAHDAYVLSLEGKPDVVVGGLTGEQRFFLAFAQRWRKAQGETVLRRQLASDNHPPGEYRSDAVRNVEAWYEAFEVTPGDKLYLKPEDRVVVW